MIYSDIIRKAFIVFVAKNDEVFNRMCICDPYTSGEAGELRESAAKMKEAIKIVRNAKYEDDKVKAVCMYHIGDVYERNR